MRHYSIVKYENGYLIQSEGKDILRCRTKKEAQQAVSDARKLIAVVGQEDAEEA